MLAAGTARAHGLDPQIVILELDVDVLDFGQDGEKGVRQYIDSQIVDAERYTPGKTDVTAQISALQQKGADFVIGFNVPAYTALTQLTALKLGYHPQWFY